MTAVPVERWDTHEVAFEASGTYVRAEGSDDFEEVNVLVSGVFVVRAAFYDEPVGVTRFWHVSEPDVARGPCAAVVT